MYTADIGAVEYGPSKELVGILKIWIAEIKRQVERKLSASSWRPRGKYLNAYVCLNKDRGN